MKDITQINKEIESIEVEMKKESITKYNYAKLSRRLSFLRDIKLYIENNPRESYLIKTKNNLQKFVARIPEMFDDYVRALRINIDNEDIVKKAKKQLSLHRTPTSPTASSSSSMQ